MNKNFNIIIRTRIRFIALLLLCGIMCSESMLAGTLTKSKRYFITGGSGITDWSEKENWELSSSDGNKYTGTFYFEGQSDNYEFKIYRKDNATLYANNGFWFNDSNTTATGVDGTENSNMQIVPCTNSWMFKVSFELWCEYSSNSKLIVTRTTESSGYFMKHNWNNKGWTWKKLTRIGSTTRYYTDDLYGGSGCNYRSNSTSSSWVESPTLVGSPTTGDNCRFTYDTSNNSITITKISDETPTVNIAANESVAGDGVSITLNGYVKYNGCKTITDYGFVYGAGSTPTTSDNKVQVGTNNISRGSSYTKTFEENSEGTYYYRAYIIAGGTTYYSSEVRTFTVAPVCNISANNFDIYVNSESESSATYDKSEKESESATLSTEKYGTTYTWSCTDYATGATSSDVHITNSNKRNASVVCDKTGVYLFQLTVTCNDNTYTSKKCTLNVCAPADEQTVYIDGYTASKACPGDQSTVTCKSESDYYYTLYLGYQSFGTLEGSGATLTWRGVTGEGEFEVKSSPKNMPQCAVTVGTATQSYVEASIEIDADPGLTVTPYKAITLSKGDDSNIDGDLIWNITEGPNGYLIDPKYSREYEYRSRSSVVFKGGLNAGGASASYTVTATGSKSEIITGTTKKTCQITESVDITVNPATESCP